MNYLFARFLLCFHGFGSLVLAFSLLPPLQMETMGNIQKQDFDDMEKSKIVLESVLPMLAAAMLTLAIHNLMTGLKATSRDELSRGLTVVVIWNVLGFFWHVRHLEVYDGSVPAWVVTDTEVEFYVIPMTMMLLYAFLCALAEIRLAFEPHLSKQKQIRV